MPFASLTNCGFAVTVVRIDTSSHLRASYLLASPLESGNSYDNN